MFKVEQIALVNMKTIAQVIVGTYFYAKPASKDFLEDRELNNVVWQAEEEVVATHNLRPLETSISNPHE
jgi:hypothetical protein